MEFFAHHGVLPEVRPAALPAAARPPPPPAPRPLGHGSADGPLRLLHGRATRAHAHHHLPPSAAAAASRAATPITLHRRARLPSGARPGADLPRGRGARVLPAGRGRL